MAIGTPVAGGLAALNAASATSSSWTPGADELLLFFAGARAASAPAKPLVTDSGGLTLTELADISQGTIRETLYWARAESSPGARTITVDSAGSTSVACQAVRISGAQVRRVSGSPNVNTAFDASAGDPSVTLPNSTTGSSTVVGGCWIDGNGNIVPSGSFVELVDTDTPGFGRVQIQYLAGAGSTCAWTTPAIVAVGIAVELDDYIAGQPAAKRFGGVPGMALIPGVF